MQAEGESPEWLKTNFNVFKAIHKAIHKAIQLHGHNVLIEHLHVSFVLLIDTVQHSVA